MSRETAAQKRERLAMQRFASAIFAFNQNAQHRLQQEPEHPKPGIYKHFKGGQYRVWCIARDVYVPEFVVIYNEVDRLIPQPIPGPDGKEGAFVVEHATSQELLGVYESGQRWYVSHDRCWQNYKYAVVGYARSLDRFVERFQLEARSTP